MSRLLLVAATMAAATQPVLVNAHSVWTLPRLGYGTRPHVLYGFAPFAIRFRLSAGVLLEERRFMRREPSPRA